MNTRLNRWWRLLGPGLLLVVLWRVGPAECWSAIRRADGRWFAAACVLVIPVIVAKGWRWRQIAAAIGVDLSRRESVGQYAAGMLAGAVTPGKLGDLVKVPFLVSKGVPTATSVAASLLDRLLDASVLVALGATGMFWMPGFRATAEPVSAVAACLGAGALAIIRRSPTLAGALAPFGRAICAVGPRWWPRLGIATVAAWIPYYGAIYCCALAVGLDISPLDLVTGVSVAALLAMLPVTIAGVGTRDAVFVLVFGRGGQDQAALALSALVLAWMAVNCGVFYLVAHFAHAEIPSITRCEK